MDIDRRAGAEAKGTCNANRFVGGSTVDKVASFFIAAALLSGVELSAHIKARKPTYSSASSGKSKRQRRDEGDETDGDDETPPLLPPTEAKALEYQLIDLMKEEGVGQDEQSAIWTLVRFLTAKKKAAG